MVSGREMRPPWRSGRYAPGGSDEAGHQLIELLGAFVHGEVAAVLEDVQAQIPVALGVSAGGAFTPRRPSSMSSSVTSARSNRHWRKNIRVPKRLGRANSPMTGSERKRSCRDPALPKPTLPTRTSFSTAVQLDHHPVAASDDEQRRVLAPK